MHRRTALSLMLATTALAACGATPGSSGYVVPAPQEGQGLIVAYRPSSAFGSGLRFPLVVNSSLVGDLTNGTVITQNVPPGDYVVQTSAPSVDGTSSVSVPVAAGQTVFIKGEALWGYPTGRPRLLLVSDAQALSDLARL